MMPSGWSGSWAQWTVQSSPAARAASTASAVGIPIRLGTVTVVPGAGVTAALADGDGCGDAPRPS